MVQLEQPLTLDALDITDTALYVQRGYPWREWDLLRRDLFSTKPAIPHISISLELWQCQ